MNNTHKTSNPLNRDINERDWNISLPIDPWSRLFNTMAFGGLFLCDLLQSPSEHHSKKLKKK